MGYIYESGEQIAVGSHGVHDYVYASGEPVTDTGLSALVFESGTGLGGGRVLMEGVNVGVFETSQSWTDFWGYQNNHDGTQANEANAAGLREYGIDDQSSYTMFVFVVHSTAENQYAIGTWGVWPGGDGTVSNPENGDYRMTYSGLDGHQIAFEQKDDPDIAHIAPDTYQLSPPVTEREMTAVRGDGVLISINEGESWTMTLEMSDFANTEKEAPGVWRGRGPDNNVDKTGGNGSTFEVQINGL